jgi:hypothetical protein
MCLYSCQSHDYLLQIDRGNPLAINALIKDITELFSKEWNRTISAADKLKIILRESEIKQVIAALNHITYQLINLNI